MFDKYKRTTDVSIDKPVRKNKKTYLFVGVLVGIISILGFTFALYDTSYDFFNMQNRATDIEYYLSIYNIVTDPDSGMVNMVLDDTNAVTSEGPTVLLSPETINFHLINYSNTAVKFELVYTCYYTLGGVERRVSSQSDCERILKMETASNLEATGQLTANGENGDRTNIRVRINPVMKNQDDYVVSKVVFGCKFGYDYNTLVKTTNIPTYGDVIIGLTIDGEPAYTLAKNSESPGYLLTNGTTACTYSNGNTTNIHYDDVTGSLQFDSLLSFPVNCDLQFVTKKKINDYFHENLSAITSLESMRFDVDTDGYPIANQNFSTIDYRFVGGNPDNYILFNNEKWRIIGLIQTAEGETTVEGMTYDSDNYNLKIIRSYNPLLEAANVSFRNEIPFNEYDNVSNVWSTSTMNTALNEIYYNSYLGVGNPLTESIPLIDSGYDYNFIGVNISDTAKSQIEPSNWFMGTAYVDNIYSYTEMYFNERNNILYDPNENYSVSPGNDEESVIWNGNIGLMSVSDFGFAGGSVCAEASSPYSAYVVDYEGNSCVANNWLISRNSSNELVNLWVMNQSADGSNFSLYLDNPSITTFTSAYVDDRTDEEGNPIYVRPSVFLKSSLYFGGGDGTFENPYMIIS